MVSLTKYRESQHVLDFELFCEKFRQIKGTSTNRILLLFNFFLLSFNPKLVWTPVQE